MVPAPQLWHAPCICCRGRLGSGDPRGAPRPQHSQSPPHPYQHGMAFGLSPMYGSHLRFHLPPSPPVSPFCSFSQFFFFRKNGWKRASHPQATNGAARARYGHFRPRAFHGLAHDHGSAAPRRPDANPWPYGPHNRPSIRAANVLYNGRGASRPADCLRP